MNKILAIDDKQDNLTAVYGLLKNLMPEYETITSLSGHDGIKKAKSEQPDVILLDIKMPGINGFETSKILKSDDNTKHIPVIMLTAISNDAESRTKGLNFGADAFLTKPIEETELIAQIKAMLRIKKAEDALRRERDYLAEKARELENFAFTVSHDLKAPLIIMGGYSSLLLKKYSEKLDETGQQYLENIRTNVVRMEKFILDLLELSRIGKVLSSQENIDTMEVLNQAIANFELQLKENRIEIIIPEPLPFSCGDKVRIKQVFSNLISNAIQYMGDQTNPMIEIGYKMSEYGYIRFHVKDNGIGIDRKNHEIVFQEFQRLKDIETEGTGIGLAIVKKIIDCHNGKVWVKSEPGDGSTFFFTLRQMI